jgi:hypothetical protein
VKNRWLVVAGILGVLAVLIAAPFLSEFLAVDGCLDSGGSFDYTANACDDQTSHPFIPYSQRHPHSLAMFSGVAAMFGVAVIASFKR